MNIETHHSVYGTPHQEPHTIIVHAMGEYILADDGHSYRHAMLHLDNLGLSVHAMATPDGSLIRLRADDEGAYHARGFNTNTLGIEILVPGQHNYASFLEAIKTDYVSEAQYAAAVIQCRAWVLKHGITKILRHSDVSPGRKVDPGAGFPWEKFVADVVAVEGINNA